MEQVYRRRDGRGAVVRSRHEKKPGRMKQAIFKQFFVCLCLLICAAIIRFSPSESFVPAQNAIRRILREDTDFATMPKQITTFFKKELFYEKNEEELGSKEVLMDMDAPVDAVVTSGFGLRDDPMAGEEKFHYGVDLGALEGEYVCASANGEVVEAGYSDSYGNYLLLQHSETVYTLYAHCESLLLKQGDNAKKGQEIATVGATGKVTGPHLHFEIRDGDTWLDPTEFVTFKKEN